MRHITYAVLALIAAVSTAQPATAAPVYLALGDSITFGETDLQYIPSLGGSGLRRSLRRYLGRPNRCKAQCD